MKHDDFSRPAKLDEHIEALSSELERRRRAQQGLADAPDLRLTRLSSMQRQASFCNLMQYPRAITSRI